MDSDPMAQWPNGVYGVYGPIAYGLMDYGPKKKRGRGRGIPTSLLSWLLTPNRNYIYNKAQAIIVIKYDITKTLLLLRRSD